MFMQEIRCFIAVAECFNFTTAANRLYMSQPGLSRIISKLEHELNVRLFTRSTRSVNLTRAGERFLSTCRDFIRQCDTLTAFSPQDSLTLSGSLTIGIGDLEENRYLPQIINEFSACHPLCDLSVRRYNPEELLGAISSGGVDFGVATSYTIPEKGFQYKVYYPSPLMLVVPPGHRLANRETVKISELKDENFLSIYRNSSRAINRIQQICAKGNFYPRIVKETNCLSTLFMLISANMGISIHFQLHKDACKHDLRFVPLDLEDGSQEENEDGAALIWKKDSTNPALQPFIRCVDVCIERFRQEAERRPPL